MRLAAPFHAWIHVAFSFTACRTAYTFAFLRRGFHQHTYKLYQYTELRYNRTFLIATSFFGVFFAIYFWPLFEHFGAIYTYILPSIKETWRLPEEAFNMQYPQTYLEATPRKLRSHREPVCCVVSSSDYYCIPKISSDFQYFQRLATIVHLVRHFALALSVLYKREAPW